MLWSWRSCCGALGLAGLLASPPASAGAPEPQVLAVTAEQGTLRSQATARLLIAKARRQGRITVVVGLDFPLARGLPAADEQRQNGELAAAQEALLVRTGIAARASAWKLEVIPAMVLEVGPLELERLLADSSVTRLSEDFALPLQLTDSVKTIHARSLWLEGLTGEGQTVAILDSGVDDDHPMLSAKIVAEACFSSRSMTGFSPAVYSPLCPNGLVKQIGPGAGKNCSKLLFPCYHGTHVAGIAAGKSTLLRGVAPDAKIIAIQVTSKGDTAEECGAGAPIPCAVPLFSNVLSGLDHVYRMRSDHQIAAVNLSLGLGLRDGGTCTFIDGGFIADAVENLRWKGIATVAAAGNDGSVAALQFPACLFTALAIGGSNDDDEVMGTSNYSVGTELLAPGQSITSAVPVGSALPAGATCLSSGRYCAITGTSQATPHVAGALALLRQAKPAATIPQLRSALGCTGTPLFRGGMSRPRIDVLRAQRELVKEDTAERHHFDGAAELEQWRQVLGSWAVAAGNLSVAAWSGSGTTTGEWVMAARKYCSSALIAEAYIVGSDPAKPTNTEEGLLLASNISKDGGTVTVTGFYFGTNHIGQVFVRRLENYPLKGGTSIGGGSGSPCAIGVGAMPNLSRKLKAVLRGDGEYEFTLNLDVKCTFTDTKMPPPVHVAVLALRPPGEEGHEFKVDFVKIRPAR